MILIGSKAIKHWFPDFPREPKDEDWATYNSHYADTIGCIKHEYLPNPVLIDYHGKTGIYKSIATPNELLTLKMSHLFWDINWEKHMWDVQFLLKKGAKVIKPLFYDLYKQWNEVHSKNKRSDLKMTALDFFDNALKCEYPHDNLHTLLKEVPTYNLVLCDNQEVEVCEDKFNELSFEDKCSLVEEEVMVMAWERWPTLRYKQSYYRMLKKFIISHAPLWEALFIIENYIVLSTPSYNFKQKIEESLWKLK